MFIGITNADNAVRITIKINPNSIPDAIWPIKYGSKKTYSERTNNPNSIVIKITDAKITYEGFEKTNFKTCVILHH